MGLQEENSDYEAKDEESWDELDTDFDEDEGDGIFDLGLILTVGGGSGAWWLVVVGGWGVGGGRGGGWWWVGVPDGILDLGLILTVPHVLLSPMPRHTPCDVESSAEIFKPGSTSRISSY